VYQDLSEKDQEFLVAMSPDVGRSKMSDIIDRMGVTGQYAQIYKQRLIDSGYVQADGHGHVRFSLPYLAEYVRAIASGLTPSSSKYDDDGWGEFPPPTR
jgi:hypothetical protein